MELSKKDNQMAKGLAIFGMIMLHLFCRNTDLPYTPLIWIDNTPLVYYLGLFGDLCVPIYCFCSGYAQALLFQKESVSYNKNRFLRLLKFLINYWIILIIFAIIGLITKTDNIPGTLSDFFGNLFLYDISYNGAWWFVLTYTILIFCSPLLCKISEKINPIVLFFTSGIIYFISYIFRFSIQIDIPHPILDKVWQQIILFGTSQFSFVVGIIFYEQKIITKLSSIKTNSVLKNIVCTTIIILLIIIHAIVQSLIIAPITGLITMICFHIMDKTKWIQQFFLFLGKHSTNIWLIHMFFYLVMFTDFVFIAKYPVFILLFMFLICFATSYIINFINSRINKLLFLKSNR